MTLFGDFVTGQTLSFQRMRALLLEGGGGLQEGVVGANDLKVAQRGAGANMSVDIPVGAAWVQIDTGTRNGLAHVYSDATANVAVTASNATNPRIDQAILRYNDTAIPTGSGNTPTLETLTGTATAGATLDNRTGAAALPNDCLRLADVLVPAASTSVTTANIRDRRPWARGAFWTFARTAGGYTTASATVALIDATNLAPRVECSGVPLRLALNGIFTHTAAATNNVFQFFIDGAQAGGYAMQQAAVSAAGNNQLNASCVLTPAAGSHVVGPAFATAAATLSVLGTATNALVFTVEEIVRPSANNT